MFHLAAFQQEPGHAAAAESRAAQQLTDPFRHRCADRFLDDADVAPAVHARQRPTALAVQLGRDLRNFGRREDGLVTVEWVALTAAMVVAAVVISYSVMTNTNTQAKSVGNNIGIQQNATYGTNGSKL